MPCRPAACRLALVCAAIASSIAAPRVSAQADVADLREDVRGLTQRLGDLSLRVEQLEHENAQLRAKIAALDRGGDAATSAQLNTAVADLNASIKSSVASSRTEILQVVADQMEKLAKQTNAALDSVARGGATVQAVPVARAAAAAVGDARPREGVSYTVQKGDTVGLIAKKTGARAQDIIDANKLADPSRIQAGQVLLVPGGK
jgi:LysM repeat protein